MPFHVLLAVDGSRFSRAAVDDLIARMRPEGAMVHVLHVVDLEELMPIAYDFARGPDYGPDVMTHVRHGRDAAEQLLGETAGRLSAAGFSAITAIQEGDPRRVILDYAAEHECNWIVMGSHGRRGLERFLMGSVSEAVARHARCSVWIVRVRQA